MRRGAARCALASGRGKPRPYAGADAHTPPAGGLKVCHPGIRETGDGSGMLLMARLEVNGLMTLSSIPGQQRCTHGLKEELLPDKWLSAREYLCQEVLRG